MQKGPVKLIKWVKIAHSFLQSVSNQFHIMILIGVNENSACIFHIRWNELVTSQGHLK